MSKLLPRSLRFHLSFVRENTKARRGRKWPGAVSTLPRLASLAFPTVACEPARCAEAGLAPVNFVHFYLQGPPAIGGK
jgi:hypothetical protein